MGWRRLSAWSRGVSILGASASLLVACSHTAHVAAPTTSTTPPPTTIASGPPPSSTPAPQTSASTPTLGRRAGVFGPASMGFGEVRPALVSNGGDPTGVLSNVTWSTWGGAQANGTGTSDYVAPGQTVAQGTQQQATVVAFNLGACAGQYMYQNVEWYFPQHGQSFDPSTYEDICNGRFVGSR